MKQGLKFSGAMAAILMSVGTANAAVEIASKAYVDQRELSSNKVTEITDANKTSDTLFPTVGALTEYADGLNSDMDERMVAVESDLDAAVVGSLAATVAQNTTDIAGNAADIAAEAERATAAEGGLQAAINTLNADETTQGSVDYKIAAAAETLSGNVDDLADDLAAEVARATGAETGLQGAITAEAERAAAAEEANAAAIAAEETRAAAAEGAINTTIGGLDGLVGADGTTAATSVNDAIKGVLGAADAAQDAADAAQDAADAAQSDATQALADAASAQATANLAIPNPGECDASSGLCVLSHTVSGDLKWEHVTVPADDAPASGGSGNGGTGV